MSDTAWIWIGIVVVALIAIQFWSNRSSRAAERNGLKYQSSNLQERVAVAQRFYLETLQRELANLILADKIEEFEKEFFAMRDWEAETKGADASRRPAEYKRLLEKYPRLEEFDL